VRELPLLRLPVTDRMRPRNVVARRMWDACAAFSPMFITPMAAVAGSVAQELIAFYERPGIERAWINNGGDIALHLAAGHSASVGLFADLARFDPRDQGPIRTDGQFEITADLPVRGVATSGWRGRSFSLGIADAVTVLARTGAEADAAATLIANAVDLPGNPAIKRIPAQDLAPDSDLGAQLVTQGVGMLAPGEVARALDNGLAVAEDFRRRGLIAGSALFLGGEARISGSVALAAPNKNPREEVAHA